MSSTSEQIDWRRSKVIELASQGQTQREIATTLQVSAATVNSDLQHLRQEAKENIKRFIEDELPHQHQLAVTGLDKIIREAWAIYEKEQDNKAKLQALNVISDAIMKKQSVLGDPAQIEKAIKTVAQLKAVIKKDESEEKEEVVSTA